jgi:aspartyl-tRNA(Asn)/glutamyl-tRNA(Gln) amidotransferase subunit B
MRVKEESHDYRYFPEPDLPPLDLRTYGVDLERERKNLPELPAARQRRFQDQYQIPAYDAGVLTATRSVADYYEAVVAAGASPKEAANWVMGSALADLNEHHRGLRVEPTRLAALIGLVAKGTVSHQAGKRVFEEMTGAPETPQVIAQQLGLVQVGDADQLGTWVAQVLKANPGEVQRYQGGEEKLLAFFTGQVMKASRGKADPKRVQDLLRERLGT